MKRQLETPMPAKSMSGSPEEIKQFLSATASAAQNSLLEGCPMCHLTYAVKPDGSFVPLMVSDRKELEIAVHTDKVTRHTTLSPDLD